MPSERRAVEENQATVCVRPSDVDDRCGTSTSSSIGAATQSRTMVAVPSRPRTKIPVDGHNLVVTSPPKYVIDTETVTVIPDARQSPPRGGGGSLKQERAATILTLA